MHYVDSTMVCRSGKGYCSSITGISKKKKKKKKKKERGKNNIRIFLFLPEHMLLVLKRTVSTKQLFWAHVTSVKLADKAKRIMLIV